MFPESNRLSENLHYFFRIYLPRHRGLSPHTVASYKQAFLQLARYCQSRFPQEPDPPIELLQTPVLLDFLAYLENERGNSPSTRNARLGALKSFFRMLALIQPRYGRQCRQTLLIPVKRTARRLFHPMDKEEVDALFSCLDPQSRQGCRDLCILRTLYNTGARASELCRLNLGDVRLQQRQVELWGKGAKARIVPLWESTAAFLHTCIKSERRRPRPADRQALFINQRRGRLTRSGLYWLCRRYLEKARQKRPSLRSKAIHPVHGWRYTTASHLLLAGVDAAVIQQWLGHTSIAATSHYAQVPVEVKRQALEKFYLFERSWQQPGGGQVDWERHPSLLAFLESL